MAVSYTHLDVYKRQDPDWAVKVREGREQDILPFSREALTSLV